MAAGEDDKPPRVGVMGGPKGLPGVGAGNMQDVFGLHRHSGQGPSDGGQLRGPYFIADQVNGHLYQIICSGGVLSARLVR